MSTPSLTMRTATSQGFMLAENSAMRPLAPASSDSTTVGASPVIWVSSAAYWRAES